MRKWLVILSTLILFSTAVGAQIWGNNPCSGAHRDREICLQMRHLRSHIQVLDAQRELLLANYELIAQYAKSLARTLSRIQEHSDDQSHTAGISSLQELTTHLTGLAEKKDPEALLAANQLRYKCSQCHSPELPTSGYSWETVFRASWDKIIELCNEEGRNPYACKHMFALFSSISYFFTAPEALDLSYETAYETAREIKRLAQVLQNLGAFHEGGNDSLREVELRAEELIELARNKDPRILQEGRQVTISCNKCHNH